MAITSCPPGQYTIGRDRHGNVICSGTQRNQLTNNTSRTTNNRSVNNTTPASQDELFTAPSTPRYYRPNGQIVPVGAPLHQHQDGTIMTEHGMGPNDNSVVVSTNGNNRVSNGNRNRTMNNGVMTSRRAARRAPAQGRSMNSGGIVHQPGLRMNSGPAGSGMIPIQSGNKIFHCPPGSTTITDFCVEVKRPYLNHA